MADEELRPILKWVGGKRQLLDEILPIIKDYSTYVEPFVGAGAVLFALKPKNAVINDYNKELINVYQVIKNEPDELIRNLTLHKERNSKDYFYEIRAQDRCDDYRGLSAVEKAARTIYLNRTCFNGVYRVNSKGQFNVPYGKYKNPKIVDEEEIKKISEYLNNSNIEIYCGDYRKVLENIEEGMFVYMDPPYMPVSKTSSFTKYTTSGFSYDDQIELCNECKKMKEKGIKFLQSNSDCKEIRELYKDFNIKEVKAKRNVNSDASKRGMVNEVLIW